MTGVKNEDFSNASALSPAPSTVVAWNGSADSRAALLWALERERARGGQLTLLTVINEAFHSCGAVAMQELAVIARRALRAEVEWLRQVDPALNVRAEVLTGDPKEQLLAHCPAGSTLAVGQREHGSAGERGSLAGRLAAAAPGPVALIAVRAATKHTDVVVGVDGSPASMQAGSVAAEEAGIDHAALRLVHAWPGMIDGVLSETSGLNEDQHRALLDAEVDRLRRQCAGLTVDGVLESGSAQAVLQRQAQTAALLVVGSRGHGPVKRLLLGSVSRNLVIRVDCPLMIVKADPV